MRWILILFIFRSSFLFGQGTPILTIDDSKKEFIISQQHLDIFEDTTTELSINQVIERFDSKSSFQKGTPIHFNQHKGSAYWLRFNVLLNSQKDYNYLLESFAPHTEDFQLFIVNSKGEIKVKKTGINVGFYNREYLNKNLLMDIPLRKGKVQTFYIRIFSNNYSEFDFRIKSNNYFSYYSTNEYFFLGLYYGILLVMALYNFIVYLYLKEKVYLYYVFYVFCGILITLTDDGLGYQYLWFDYPKWNPIIGYHIAPSLLLVSFVFYARVFLDLKRLFPTQDKLIFQVLAGYFLYYLMELTILPETMQVRGAYLIPYLLVYYTAIKCFLSGYKSARLFIIGYSLIFISIIIIQLRANGTIDGNIFTVYAFNYGLILEVIVLSFGLADRVKILKKEKELANGLAEMHSLEREGLQELVSKQSEENFRFQQQTIQELEAKNRETQATKSMLIKILNEIPLKVFLKKYNGEFYVVNDSVAKFHNLSAEELIGKSDADFYDAKDAQEWLEAEHEIIAKGRQEYENEDNGRLLRTVKMPFYIDPLHETGLLGFQQDITEYIKEREKTQKEIIRQLEANNELKEKINKQLEENNLLQEKVNRELEQKVQERTAEVVKQTQELEAQSVKIEALYKEVTDSIQTAKIIQQSILPSDAAMKMFLPNMFVLYKPKDIVSGDFYWFYIKNNKIIIAAVDCTGHGVAGAFMSLIGYNLLNQIVKEKNTPNASEILNKLNQGVISSLHQDEAGSLSREGMDIALCIIDITNSKIQFSGANNPLYHIRGEELTVYKADKFSIGIQRGGKVAEFTNQEIGYLKGDQIYLFSDGYAGQIGGEEGDQKFMLPRFRELLLSIRHLPMDEQSAALETAIEEWKNGQEQLDDILVMGIRF